MVFAPPCGRCIFRIRCTFVDSKTVGLDVACRLIAAGAVVELLRYRCGRIGLGPFLFGAGLLTLNLHWPPFTSHIPSEGYLLAEVLFGSSMLLVVLDDSRLRTRRLAMLNELTRHHCARPESRSHDADRAGKTEGRSGGEGGVVPVDGRRASGADAARRPVAGISASPGANPGGTNWDGWNPGPRSPGKPGGGDEALGDVGAGARTTGEARHSSCGAAAGAGQEIGDRDAVARLLRQPAPHRGKNWSFWKRRRRSWGLRWRICGCWSRCCARSSSG